MIKLVTQFDNEKSKIALATPTCGACCGCCSCCCCLISTLAVSAFSARSFALLTRNNEIPPEDVGNLDNEPPERDKLASFIFFFIPALTVTMFATLFMFLRDLRYGFDGTYFGVFMVCALIWAGLFFILIKRNHSKKKIIILSIISAIILAGLVVAEAAIVINLFG
jgi:hypothetical protein